MPQIDYEPFKKYPQVSGVFVGGCVVRGDGSSFRGKAHTHNVPGSDLGYICVRSPRRLYTASGNPGNTMLHELAHVLTGQGHTQAWADKARELGCRIKKGRYPHVK